MATRYPSERILDRVASPEDLDAVFELEGWTNDCISTDLGILLRVPRDERVVGAPLASVIMAAFCHPRPGGARFNDAERGAWYASFTLETAHAQALYHRGRELDEVGVAERPPCRRHVPGVLSPVARRGRPRRRPLRVSMEPRVGAAHPAHDVKQGSYLRSMRADARGASQ